MSNDNAPMETQAVASDVLKDIEDKSVRNLCESGGDTSVTSGKTW